jgi:hypothetical protein
MAHQVVDEPSGVSQRDRTQERSTRPTRRSMATAVDPEIFDGGHPPSIDIEQLTFQCQLLLNGLVWLEGSPLSLAIHPVDACLAREGAP